jgi:hypothetical protein
MTAHSLRRWFVLLAGSGTLSLVLMLLAFSPILLFGSIVLFSQGANPASYWLTKVQEDGSALLLIWLGIFLPVAAVIVSDIQNRRNFQKGVRE